MFAQICDLEQLVSSYYLARRGKRDKPRICEFDFFLESNLVKLKYLLNSGNYTPSPYAHFTIYDPKTRQVAAPAFRDRVLQHSLVNIIEPLFEKRFIYDSYACRKGKGTHFGAKRVKKFLMAARCINGGDKEIYVLQCDIQKFFQSISWDVLLSLFSTVVTELPAVSVDKRKGLPIGNLTSQLFANIYLNELDHFVKEILRERWYARYMDDFLIIHPDKNHLREVKEKIRTFLKDALDLQLHPKKVAIKNVSEGVPFVGYRIFYDHMLVRGSTLRRIQKKYRKRIKLFRKGLISQDELSQAHSSIRGHLKHANAHRLYSFMVENDV